MVQDKTGYSSWFDISQSNEFDQDMVLTLGLKNVAAVNLQNTYKYARYNGIGQVEYGTASNI